MQNRMRIVWARALQALALASVILLCSPQQALACDCPYLPAPRAALADSNAVFIGTVTMVQQPGPELRLQRSFPFIIYDTPSYAGVTIRLSISEIWRGPDYRTVTLTTGQPYSGCGVGFVEGETYLVYAYINGVGNLMTHRCSRTATVLRAEEDLALFGAGRRPTRDAPPEMTAPQLIAATCGIVLAAALITLGYLLQRRRRTVVS
jgi:hypothetical protein